MQKEKVEKLRGRTLTHKKFGNVYVKDIVSAKDDKIIGVIENTGEEKMFILSSNYFSKLDNITFKKKFQEKPVRVHVKKTRDVSKYSNHPFLRKIDAQEKQKNRLYTSAIDEDEDDTDQDSDW